MRRRSFLHAFGAGVLGARGSFAVATQDTEAFEIPILGDLHFDKLEHHDFEWMRSSHTGDIRQVENYSKVTREWSPQLMKTIKRRMTGQGRIPFILQLGDLLEGLCGSEALAERQAKEAVTWVQEAVPAVPFAMCKGNHDVTGPGAAAVYDRVLVPFMNEWLNGVDAARYTRSESGTLIVFYDAYDKTSLEWFTKLMAEKQPKRLIFVIHPPVVPYNARASWHLFAKPAEAEKRTQLLNLLGKYRAVVLCGHLHKYSCVARTTETGRFVQLAISSVATNETGEPKHARQGLDAYTPGLVELEPNHAPETVEARRALLAAEQPFITHYDYADTWGHAILRVSNDGVKAHVCRGFGMETWRDIDLSALTA